MADQPVYKKDWILTGPALEKLLNCLKAAGVDYLELRRRLEKFFEYNRIPDPDELIDITFDRAARRMEEGEQVLKPVSYITTVARFVEDELQVVIEGSHQRFSWGVLAALQEAAGLLRDFGVPKLAGEEHLVGVALPPVVGRKDLDLVRTAVAGLLHPRADQRQIDHTIAHHAAIEKQIGGGHQQVHDVRQAFAVVTDHLITEIRQTDRADQELVEQSRGGRDAGEVFHRAALDDDAVQAVVTQGRRPCPSPN